MVPSHMELFHGGRRLTLARWPSEQRNRIVKPAVLAPERDGHSGQRGKLETGSHYDGNRPRRWHDLDDVWVHGYWQRDTAAPYEQVDSIDFDARLIRSRPSYGVYGFASGRRFHYLDVPEEFDAIGEYCIDRRARRLYFLPPVVDSAGADPETAVSILEEAIILKKAVETCLPADLACDGCRSHQQIAATTLRLQSNTLPAGSIL